MPGLPGNQDKGEKLVNRPIYFSITAVAVIFGLMLAFQFRNTSRISGSVPYNRIQELIIEKKQLEKENTNLSDEINDLTAKLAVAGRSVSEAGAALRGELEKTKLIAGLVPVSGPGVEVTLSELLGEGGAGNASSYIIRDDDLLKLVNELRGAGAEAIAIDGQRVVATTEIRMVGNNINVNLVRVSTPYRVTAIGNAEVLKSSLEAKGGLAEYLSTLGVTVAVQAKERVNIPAFKGSLDFDYAKSVQKG
ncbi:MAG: DUF881 domain-containing protein [Peptococcaceae bacterium]|nr:MAG: DUF881 domain-containing protein [Peptococcaceae bacterium]